MQSIWQKNAGYETFWISAQEPLRLGQNGVGYLSSTADSTIFRMGEDGRDLLLIPIIKQHIKAGVKQCFFVHTFGSHEPYSTQSTAEDLAAITGSSKLDDYDRSIHYSDRFINRMNRLASESKTSGSILYYFSDHGEIPGKGHGLKYAGSAQFEVPIFAINYSPLLVDSIMNLYVDKQPQYINTSSTIYILAQFMGYDVSPKVIENAVEMTKYVYTGESKPQTLVEVDAIKR